VADAKLDALIARGYLAADEREAAEALQAAIEAFLADRLSGGHFHQVLRARRRPVVLGRPTRDALRMSPSGVAQVTLS
jgi:hypothetical protein